MAKPSEPLSSVDGERIAKFLARAGVCSRRDAEKLIAEGRVKLNGKTLDTPAVKVTDKDRVLVDGRQIGAAEPTRLWRYHKPTGLVTTHRDPGGRPTVFENLPPGLPRVVSVGRLDLNSEGLLLLTNDGALARRLELPSNGWVRRYRARAFGRVKQEDLDMLKDGIEVDGIRYGGIDADLERGQGANAWINVAIREGKNREVRRVLEAIGLKVNRLIRVAYGPFQLGTLEPGAVDEVSRKQLQQLGSN
jgi:23S rRNA pseudouridine2605 synthase